MSLEMNEVLSVDRATTLHLKPKTLLSGSQMTLKTWLANTILFSGKSGLLGLGSCPWSEILSEQWCLKAGQEPCPYLSVSPCSTPVDGKIYRILQPSILSQSKQLEGPGHEISFSVRKLYHNKEYKSSPLEFLWGILVKILWYQVIGTPWLEGT